MKDVIAVLKLEGDLRYFSSNEGPRPDATSGVQWILDTLSSDEHEVIVKATSAGLLFDVLVNHNSCGYFMMKTIVKMLPEKDLQLPELLYHGVSDAGVIEDLLKVYEDVFVQPLFGGLWHES
jgi:hypothetical protein